MDYIIEYQSREQYDVYGNCKPKSHAKSFSKNMQVMFNWEQEMGFFIMPTIFVKDWPRVFGITFLWLKF